MLKTFKLSALASAAALMPALVTSASAQELNVVATFSIIGDFARQVGGDRIALTTLVGPDGDAHVYEPQPADGVAMARADIVLMNGLQFEGFLARLVEATATDATIVEVSQGAEILEAGEGAHIHGAGADVFEGHDDHENGEVSRAHDEAEITGAAHDDQGAKDPHAWQSVHNAETYVKNIATAFCEADVTGCDIYNANAEAYVAELEALDKEIREIVASIPEDKRTIITSHDAFGYFAAEYGISFVAPEGVSTESEASAADIAALIEQARGDQASAIFVESITNPRLIEQIASETGLQVGGALYSDALSAEDGPAPTYIDMMRHNAQTIEGAITLR